MFKDFDAAELLTRMSTSYEQLNWYYDSGYVLTIFAHESEEQTAARTDFKTFFCRPNLFRFEWSDGYTKQSPDLGSVVWSDGTRVYKKYGSEIILVKSDSVSTSILDNLELAIAGATGVSSGVAPIVSSLLFPLSNFNNIGNLVEARFVGDDQLSGELCHCVHGSFFNRQSKLWISSTRNILLKLREHYMMDIDSRRHKNVEWLYDRQVKLKSDKFLGSNWGKFVEVRRITVFKDVALNDPFSMNMFASANIE